MKKIGGIAIAALMVVFAIVAASALANDGTIRAGDLRAAVQGTLPSMGVSSTPPMQDVSVEVLTPTPTEPVATATASPKLVAITNSLAAKASAKPKETATVKPSATVKPNATVISPSAGQAVQAAIGTSSEINAQVQSFKVTAKRYYDSYGFSSNRYKYTEAEVRMLAVVIHMEARGEPYRAKLAIANVVMNRVLAPGYPGATIKAVVTAPNQFCYKAGVSPTAECVRAARDVLENETWVVPQNTYFFRATGSKSNWGRHEYWGRIGGTTFYQDRYSGRYNGDAVPDRLFERIFKWPQYGCKAASRVHRIQVMLNSLGYKVAQDGHFGTGTKKALMDFQHVSGLAADGIAGPATLAALIKKSGQH